MGSKVYDAYRQDSVLLPPCMQFPPRKPSASGGSGFSEKVSGLSAAERDSLVFKELSSGNIPEFLRSYVLITDSLKDVEGKMHRVALSVSADYMAVGNDSVFVRVLYALFSDEDGPMREPGYIQ